MKKQLAAGIIIIIASMILIGSCSRSSGAAAATTTAAGISSAGGVRSEKWYEAPELNEQVKAGTLPPVEQRLPENPVVVTPKERIGKYGGTVYTTVMNPFTTSDVELMMHYNLVRFNNDVTETINHVAEWYEFSNDFKTFTVKLRPGIKWSSGNPLTVDDIIFTFDDFIYDLDIQPGISNSWAPGGTPAKLTKVDQYTVRFDFAAPCPNFGPVNKTDYVEPYVDSEWTKQFHLKYNPDADALAKSLGYDSWQNCIIAMVNGPNGGFMGMPRYYGAVTAGRPTLGAWMPVEANSIRQVWERNPYYWMVDTEGNQLPYIDRMVEEYVGDLNVVNLRAMTGELTIAGLDLLLINYPDLKANEERGNYKVELVYSERTADVAFCFNQVHPDPQLNRLFTNPQFRKAISMGIDRDEINELVFLGQGTIMQATINPSAAFFEEQWGKEAVQFDPDQANAILDSLGVQRRNAAGIRLLPDGREFSFRLEYLANEGPKKETLELVSMHLEKYLGIKCEALSRDRGYLQSQLDASNFDASGWHVDRVLERAAWYEVGGGKLSAVGNSMITHSAPYNRWFGANPASGIEPPQNIKDLWDKFQLWQSLPYRSPEYMAAAKAVYTQVMEETLIIGVIGQAPQPLVIKNNLKNVFSAEDRNKKLLWGAANWFWGAITLPEQLYLE